MDTRPAGRWSTKFSVLVSETFVFGAGSEYIRIGVIFVVNKTI